MKAEQEGDFWTNTNGGVGGWREVPACSKETNSTAEVGILDHFDKIPNSKTLESFNTREIPNPHCSDPCFTPPLKQLDFFCIPSSTSCSESVLFCLKIYYKKNYSAGNHRHCSRQTGRKPVHTCSEFCFGNVLD